MKMKSLIRALSGVMVSACVLVACGGVPGSIGINKGKLPAGAVDNTPPPEQPSLDTQVLADVPTSSYCDFLNREYCTFPFPNDFFTVEDKTTDTGRRINFSILAMPKNILGKPIDPTEWNRNDGFSPGQMILARIPGLDMQQTGAVPLTNVGDSLRADQPIVVIDADTGERHLIWSELDANITKFGPCDAGKLGATAAAIAGEVGAPEQVEQLGDAIHALVEQCKKLPLPENPLQDPGPALLIRPAANFKEGHRYIVALRNLKNAAGEVIEAPVSFRIFRDNHASSLPMVTGRRDHFESLFESLGKAGIERGSLYMAWDFTVASQRNLSERVLHIRDDAFAKLGDTTPGDGIVQGKSPTISDVTVEDHVDDGNIARVVRGVIEVPSYLNLPFGITGSKFYYKPDASGLYGDGLPDVNPFTATQKFDFMCRLPRRAFGGAQNPAEATSFEKVRPALYGHGLLGSKNEGSGQIGDMIQEHAMAYCATDWIGMASHEFDPTSGNVVDPVYKDPPLGDVSNVLRLLIDFSDFGSLPDRVQQGFVNFMYLGRAAIHPEGLCALDAFKVNGQCVLDTSELFYDGNSQGGILGGALVALSPDMNAGVLGVVGMNYSTLLQRSVDFDLYATFMYTSYGASLDQQFILSMVQMLWDRGENNAYAQHMNLTDPYPNTPPKRVLLHPAFGDHQVTMWSAEVMARSIGASVHCPAVVGGPSVQRGEKVLKSANPAVIAEGDLAKGRRHPDDEPYYGIPCLSDDNAKGSAIVVWDGGPTVKADGSPNEFGVAPPPTDNTPPRPELGYGADPHSFPRTTPAARLQKSEFLKSGGKVVDTCDGKPCATRDFDTNP